jgi:hypothetical protein
MILLILVFCLSKLYIIDECVPRNVLTKTILLCCIEHMSIELCCYHLHLMVITSPVEHSYMHTVGID